MLCESSKCKNKIYLETKCSFCDKRLCCKNCLIEHQLESHKSELAKKSSPSIMKGNQSYQSIYLKPGIYSRDFKNENKFEKSNFDFVKMGLVNFNLGSGAFGEVYLAKNKLDGNYYAIKQMNKTKIKDFGASLDIVEREISIHRRLTHEHIVKLYSSFEDDGNYYLVLEYVNNGSLYNLIQKEKGMTEEKAFKYFIQTVSAVNFLHENNLVHRDLKPENLLLNENDEIKLCDFGWCVELSIGNRITFCGTYEYMAPEIIKELPYNHSIDVWSLGVLLYELLHGYSPFRSKDDVQKEDDYTEIFKNIIKVKFSIEREDLTDNCQDLIHKLLSVDNKTRIKLKDILTHPWVKNFERQELTRLSSSKTNESASRQSFGNEIESEYSTEKDIQKIRSLESELAKAKILKDINKNSLSKKVTFSENFNYEDFQSEKDQQDFEKPRIFKEKNKSLSGSNTEDKKKKELNQEQQHAQSQIRKLLSSNENMKYENEDLMALKSSEKESLFDKVLTQVQTKKKTKGYSTKNLNNQLSVNDFNILLEKEYSTNKEQTDLFENKMAFISPDKDRNRKLSQGLISFNQSQHIQTPIVNLTVTQEGSKTDVVKKVPIATNALSSKNLKRVYSPRNFINMQENTFEALKISDEGGEITRKLKKSPKAIPMKDRYLNKQCNEESNAQVLNTLKRNISGVAISSGTCSGDEDFKVKFQQRSSNVGSCTTVSEAKDSNRDVKRYSKKGNYNIDEEEIQDSIESHYLQTEAKSSAVKQEYGHPSLNLIKNISQSSSNLINVNATLNFLNKAKDNKHKTNMVHKDKEKKNDFWSEVANFFQPFKCNNASNHP